MYPTLPKLDARHLQRHTSESYELAVSKDKVNGHTFNHKFGGNPAVGTGAFESVWTYGGLYPWAALGSGEVIYVKSSSASDTASITIEGLDENRNEVSEVLTLTGTAAVTSTKLFTRVFRMYVDVINVGEITAHADSATGSVVGHIDTGKGQTLMALYSVPAGHTAFIFNIEVTITGGKTGLLEVYKDNRIAHSAEVIDQYWREFPFPLRVEELTDIDFRLIGITQECSSTVTFDMVVVDNNHL